MIAIADFGAGAMENWGLITYKETYLLVDNHFTAQETKQEVALIVAHEIAHQWFGNLVVNFFRFEIESTLFSSRQWSGGTIFG